MRKELIKHKKACDKLDKIGGNHDTNKEIGETWITFYRKYNKWLPKDAKVKAEDLQKDFEKKNGPKSEMDYYKSVKNATQYWQYVKYDGKVIRKNYTKTVEIFEQNSKKIQNDNLGGVHFDRSAIFRKELSHL